MGSRDTFTSVGMEGKIRIVIFILRSELWFKVELHVISQKEFVQVLNSMILMLI